MRQQSFRHRGAKRSGIGGGVLVVVAVVAGAFAVYQLILWFRSDSAKTLAKDSAVASLDSPIAPLAASAVSLNSTAVLHVTDGGSAGTVVRSGTVEVPSYSLVANLVPPALDATYEAWLVKDGLADVKSVATLNPRADGSWAATFSTKDPLDYPTIVIMAEPNDGNAEPSGNRVAEGRFE